MSGAKLNWSEADQSRSRLSGPIVLSKSPSRVMKRPAADVDEPEQVNGPGAVPDEPSAAGAEVALVLLDRIQLAIAHVHRGVARPSGVLMPATKVMSFELPSVTLLSGRPKLRLPHEIGDGVVVLVVLVQAVLRVDAHALEVVVHDEVDDAGDSIGAVHGRSAARQHFDTLDQRRRDLVEIGRGRAVLRRIAGHQSPAVHQHQRALRAEAAQIHRRGAGRAVRQVAAEIGNRLRQIVDQVFDARDALDLDLIGADRRDRTDARQARLGDARAGDDDFLNRAFVRSMDRLDESDSACGTEHERTAHGQREIVVS